MKSSFHCCLFVNIRFEVFEKKFEWMLNTVSKKKLSNDSESKNIKLYILLDVYFILSIVIHQIGSRNLENGSATTFIFWEMITS